MKRTLLNILILLIGSPQLSAQIQQIAEKLNDYCRQVPREEVYVHTDRDSYIAGEDVWMKMYSFERFTGKPSSSTLVYFELLSYGNRPVIRKRFRLEGGSGPCHIALPDTLSPGIYTIRAYTNVMKNFMPGNCFIKEVNIYSALSSVERKKTADRISQKPDSAQQVLRLDIENEKPDSIIIHFSAGLTQVKAGPLFILIHSRGKIYFAQSIYPTENHLKYPVARKLFDRGILHITLFNSTGIPLAERFVYSPAPGEDLLSISTEDSLSYREKIYLNLGGPGGDFSVAVSPYTGYSSDISDYMIYGSEFGSTIQKAFSGKRLEDLPRSYIDSLLAGAHSNWISWDRVLSGNLGENKYPAEVNEHFLTGSLVNAGPSDEFVIMSIPGKEAQFQYSVTDADGNFSFSIPADGEQRTLIIQPDDVNSGSVVRLGSSFMEDYLLQESIHDTSSIPAFIDNFSANYQVAKIYGTVFSSPSTRVPSVSFSTRRFYGKPDVEVKLEDYIKLPVMEEVFFEIIPGASLKKRRTGYEISIADPVTNSFYSVPPSLFMDGVRIDNAEIIANIDPELVEKIDVVLERYLIGDYIFYGIVNVITKRADLSSIELPGYALRTRYRVFDPVSEFTAPAYNNPEAKKDRIPDFRNTLYWNPSVLLKAGESRALEFWSSDVPGQYEINIQGITSDGRTVTSKKIITVK